MAHILEVYLVYLVHLDHLVHLEEMGTTQVSMDQLSGASTLQNIFRVRQNLSFDIFNQR